jgi:hypothetical protein
MGPLGSVTDGLCRTVWEVLDADVRLRRCDGLELRISCASCFISDWPDFFGRGVIFTFFQQLTFEAHTLGLVFVQDHTSSRFLAGWLSAS